MKIKILLFCLAAVLTGFAIVKEMSGPSRFQTVTPLKLDLEHLSETGSPVTSSTQSLNRYASNLRQLESAALDFDAKNNLLSLRLVDETDKNLLSIERVDAHFLVPLLPYKRRGLSSFDRGNIVLAEFARNGINLAFQADNDLYADVRFSGQIFNDEGEYFFKNGKYEANPGVKPVRLSLVNNCLRPGLWEISAKDAVGEMYHSWFELPGTFYNNILSSVLNIAPKKLEFDFSDPKVFENVPLELERLRALQSKIAETPILYNDEKMLGSYSNQDARRKVQRKFYRLNRNNAPLKAARQSELMDGDVFCMHSFQEPGVYNPNTCTEVPFERKWETAEIYQVSPKTSYPGQENGTEESCLELKVFSGDKSEVLVAGNIPMSLLTLKKDFVIPAFGAGVLQSSEHIERRYLRLKEGIRPTYAYLARQENERLYMLNNHLSGYEQLYIRPILKAEKAYLQVTIVSYERITDLVEFLIPVPELKQAILKATAAYQPPIYEIYSDHNIL